MSVKILINAVDPEECRIARVTEGKLEEFHTESTSKEITQGNIYKGVIARVEPGLQSVFVDYGAERHGFLQKSEIHSDYFQDTDSGDRSLKNLVKKGQELFVQVTKDPVMKKGAMLTTFISLPGRHVVLMPGSDTSGISRKIEDEAERSRLKEVVSSLKLPDGFGVIVRTAGVGCTKTVIAKDVKYLERLWKDINKKGINATAPAPLYKEQHLVLRSIRDYFTQDVDEILIDNPDVYQEVRKFVEIISPKQVGIVKLHKGQKPIFTKYELERQIASIFESRVSLKSGGSVVIEQTEALVAIDVNSGKGSHQKSVEQTAYLTNLEAAEEIARQLRLRDLGGLIVIDFIDMKESKHNSAVEKAIKTFTKTDKARMKIGKISKFGILEMSRQRIAPPIEYGSYIPCKCCNGKGLIPSIESLGIRFLRRLQSESLKEKLISMKGIVPPAVADYLLNKKRKDLVDLELRREVGIRIEADSKMNPTDSEIICEAQ
jgi:ribonuclease E